MRLSRGVVASVSTLLTALVEPAAAVVVVGDGMERPTLAYLASWNGCSAVAIGAEWAITAKHVGGSAGGALTMNGDTFTVSTVITNPTTDLALVRINGRFGGWHRITPAIGVGDRMIIGGMGRTRGAPVGEIGWDWGGPKRETWGENRLDAVINGILAARFDMPDSGGLPSEAGIALNDSGGGMFVEALGGSLQLAGIHLGVSVQGQTVDGSVSYGLRLAPYIGWIQSVIGAPVTGPLNELFVPTPGTAAMFGVGAWIGLRRRR